MKAVLLCALLVFSAHSIGQSLTVIYDSGDILPIEPYQARVQKDNDVESPLQQPKKDKTNSPFLSVFPVTTPTMTPDIVDPRPMSLPSLPSPLFIMGNDALSLQWLRERRAELMRVRAVGMLIEVRSIEEFNTIQQLASGLHIYPASGVEIGEQLNLKHYPALISSVGIEQ